MKDFRRLLSSEEGLRSMRFEPIDVSIAELEQLVEQTAHGALPVAERQKLRAAIATLKTMAELLAARDTKISELRALLLAPRTTEKTQKVLAEVTPEPRVPEKPKGNSLSDHNTNNQNHKKKGHGRNGAAAYASAPKVEVPHPTLKHKDRCPECWLGKVYLLDEPKSLVRLIGQPPVQATVYELQTLRCNLCGEVFTPPQPASASEEKYDATAKSMIALLKYGAGVPFNRLAQLHRQFQIPLPAATQWELLAAVAKSIKPIYEELIKQAAQGQVLHNDDTSMRILRFAREASDLRQGIFTSGIVSLAAGHRIALFFTGRDHAGENLTRLLEQRPADLGPPIQMCDALSRNAPKPLPVNLANCLAHGRRHFVNVLKNFPEQCRFVLETLRAVFHYDALAKAQGLEPAERLRFHQQHSQPLMDQLQAWCHKQFDHHQVEPNSGLGHAIQYLLNHWPKLTLFLRQAGAPLDNNICERALKKAILHRKNALFYRTQNGAHVGDLFMSLIHTAELCGTNHFDYLTQLQRHAAEVARAPRPLVTLELYGHAARLGSRCLTVELGSACPTRRPKSQYAGLPKAHETHQGLKP